MNSKPQENCNQALTRRSFQLALLGLSTELLSACTAPTNQEVVEKSLVFVGTDNGNVSALQFDAGTGKLVALDSVAEAHKPRWAVTHPQIPVLYVTAEGMASEGSIKAFAINNKTGALKKINEVSAGGKGTTHLWFDMVSMTLLAANFGSGSTSSIKINQDGSLGSLVSTIKSQGSGPHRRQTSPHAHGVAVSPSGRHAIVADMGADRVFVYDFDRSTHVLKLDNTAKPRSFIAPPGSGPRHLVFGFTGKTLYLLSELSAEVSTFNWDDQQGLLTLKQSIPVNRPEFQGTKSGSEIAISADGRFIYVSERGENSLLTYLVDSNTGTLSLAQRTASGGELPWTFAIHSSGKWLLVANQRSNRINVFSINPITGKVIETGHSINLPSPISITFA